MLLKVLEQSISEWQQVQMAGLCPFVIAPSVFSIQPIYVLK
jgi:hypothetical protein